MAQGYDPLLDGGTKFRDLYNQINATTEALRSTFSGLVAPEDPAIGQPFYNKDTKELSYWSGTQWEDVGNLSTAMRQAIASIPGLVDVSSQAAQAEVNATRDAAISAVNVAEAESIGDVEDAKDAAVVEIDATKADLQDQINVGKSKQAREIGGQAYQTLLGFPCPPSLEVKAWDAKDNTNGVPNGFTFARASSATQVNAAGQIETVGNDVLRHDYDPETGEYKGFLIEEQRTNLLLYSGTFDVANWPRVRSSVVAGVDAPDGSQSIKITEDNTLNQNHMFQSSYAVPGPGDYTASIFIKSDEREEIRLFASGAGGSKAAFFNASNGTVMGDGAITDYGNGWYRCSVTVSTSESGTLFVFVQLSKNSNHIYDGDGASGLYLWGAQLEQGSFSTSYIPTTTAAATRAADNLIIAIADFPYNQSEGTLLVESGVVDNPNVRMLSLNDGSDRIEIRTWGDNTIRCSVYVSGVYQANMSLGLSTATTKITFAYKADDCAGVINGENVATDTSVVLPASLTEFGIGSMGTYSLLNGHIRHFAYFPRRLSNEQLQALTR